MPAIWPLGSGNSRLTGEREARPSASVLRDVVAGLGALFGRPSGVIVATEIKALSLPSYKRRALVLAANELVVNSLLHAFHGRRTGVIEIALTVRAAKSASLCVADDGIGFTGQRPNLNCGVAAGLAGLLEAELEYARKSGRHDRGNRISSLWILVDHAMKCSDRANWKDACRLERPTTERVRRPADWSAFTLTAQGKGTLAVYLIA